MIKINLLPQKRAKKRDAATEGATQPLLFPRPESAATTSVPGLIAVPPL